MAKSNENLNFQQNDIHLNNFKSSGVVTKAENGKKYDWVMRGSSADIINNNFAIYDLDMTIIPQSDKDLVETPQKKSDNNFIKGEIRMLSPFCNFDQRASELRSPEYVHILSQGFSAEGIGYDVYFNRENIIITLRNSVKIVLKNVQTNSIDLK